MKLTELPNGVWIDPAKITKLNPVDGFQCADTDGLPPRLVVWLGDDSTVVATQTVEEAQELARTLADLANQP